MQIAEGVYQVQLPLPFLLRIVNCYLLQDGPGWAVIDAGLNYPAGRAAWQAAFAALGIGPAQITRIILTHAHPDHYGMAGWLAAQSGAPVLLSPLDQAFARHVWGECELSARETAEFFQAHGMPAALAETIRADVVALCEWTRPAPPEMTALEHGAQIAIGPRRFQALATPGHSDGHLVFYCAEERLLLCGDTVLTKITPNISLWPRSRPNPLADFLRSLDALEQLDVALALPGHGPLISAFRQRLGELRDHHRERLRAIEQVCAGGATAFAVCTAVFPTAELSPHQIRFAMAETLAHLEYLAEAGRLRRAQGEPLTYWRG